MRLPFTKSASPDPELNFPSLPGADPSGDTPSVCLEADPSMDASFSPGARQSALHLVGTIRDILVGDQIRNLDTRFAGLHSAIEGSVTTYVEGIASSVDAIQDSLHSEIGDLRNAISEISAGCEARFEETAADLTRGAASIDSLQENVSLSAAQLRSEDARINIALEESIARVAALEATLAEKIDSVDRRREADAMETQRSAARIEVLENELRAASENLQGQDAVLNDNIRAATAQVAALQVDFSGRIDELSNRLRGHVDGVEKDNERLRSLEERSEALRVGFNQKMSEICDYVAAQVERATRINAPAPAPRPSRPAASPAPAAAPAPAPAARAVQPRPCAQAQPRARAQAPAPAPAPAPVPGTHPTGTTRASSTKFPSFPPFPSFTSYDPPKQNTRPGVGS